MKSEKIHSVELFEKTIHVIGDEQMRDMFMKLGLLRTASLRRKHTPEEVILRVLADNIKDHLAEVQRQMERDTNNHNLMRVFSFFDQLHRELLRLRRLDE